MRDHANTSNVIINKGILRHDAMWSTNPLICDAITIQHDFFLVGLNLMAPYFLISALHRNTALAPREKYP